MILKDISFPTPHENILYDEVLLHLAEKENAGEFLRFWESRQTFVVLGRICKESEDLRIANIKKDRVPVVRRASGGGTVLQGKGCLNYSLIIAKDRYKGLGDISRSYQIILQRIVDAFSSLDVQTKFWPISDIALSNNRKFSGNAQKRGRGFILHHGTILYDFDLPLIERYLEMPKAIPEYRQGRPHLEFVANVPVRAKEIKKRLIKGFNVEEKGELVTNNEKVLLNSYIKNRNINIVV